MNPHKIRVTVDPHTGEAAWNFLLRRSPDAEMAQLEVSAVDETTGIEYGPATLLPVVVEPGPDPEPEPEPIAATVTLTPADPTVAVGGKLRLHAIATDDAGTVLSESHDADAVYYPDEWRFGPQPGSPGSQYFEVDKFGLLKNVKQPTPQPVKAWAEHVASGMVASIMVTVTGAAVEPDKPPPEVEPVPDTDPVPVPPPVVVPPPTGNTAILTPAGLEPVVGRLIARSATSGPVAALDARFAANEDAAYLDAIALLDKGAANMANHYDGLAGRFQRAIRDGDPTGPLYVRGREIVLRYLAWSKGAKFQIPPHNNTGMAGIEILATLEGNADAIAHIHTIAGFASGPDQWNYAKGLAAKSDPRQAAVALQAHMAAHRLGVPFRTSPANKNAVPLASLGSWLAAGQRQIQWLAANFVRPDGSVPSPSHTGREAYFMNAMVATELLRWYRDMEQDPAVLALATRIVGHLADEFERIGGPLGYLSGRAAGSSNDLAAFYVWPGLAIWQESADPRFRAFALAHMQAAANAGNQTQAKQWQQAMSTRAQEAEPLLAGVSWR